MGAFTLAWLRLEASMSISAMATAGTYSQLTASLVSQRSMRGSCIRVSSCHKLLGNLSVVVANLLGRGVRGQIVQLQASCVGLGHQRAIGGPVIRFGVVVGSCLAGLGALGLFAVQLRLLGLDLGVEHGALADQLVATDGQLQVGRHDAVLECLRATLLPALPQAVVGAADGGVLGVALVRGCARLSWWLRRLVDRH